MNNSLYSGCNQLMTKIGRLAVLLGREGWLQPGMSIVWLGNKKVHNSSLYYCNTHPHIDTQASSEHQGYHIADSSLINTLLVCLWYLDDGHGSTQLVFVCLQPFTLPCCIFLISESDKIADEANWNENRSMSGSYTKKTFFGLKN